ncbi:putative cell surface spherulin 4-like protein [Phaeomoniella chlamydospora]|uniref:Putative cell surface spherulin 4-like protein n=1 Tax=Phaeomoniella chlamydospora TaxID=158046 RepID=A0A0G2EKE1_PHACM|nr:putative cell surface spherulin 4-like protein [Phaeomoniella chlamydospora]
MDLTPETPEYKLPALEFQNKHLTSVKFTPRAKLNPKLLGNDLAQDNFPAMTARRRSSAMQTHAFVLVPLYIYPEAGKWDPLYTAISEYPTLLFSIVINPQNGPGGSPGSFPDANYMNGISTLRSYPNVQLLGYVHTSGTARPMRQIESDLLTYATWSSHPRVRLALDGVFIDECPSDDLSSTIEYMRAVCTFARHTIAGAHLTFNPGVPVPEVYYSLADTIVTFEDHHNKLSTDVAKFPFDHIPDSVRCRCAFLIHDYKGDDRKQADLVTTIVGRMGIPGLFITTHSYERWSELWEDFVDDLSDVKVGIKYEEEPKGWKKLMGRLLRD